MKKISIDEVKKFAEKQMDAMWHDNSGQAILNMVRFYFKGYVVVNPWMDETTSKPVNPYLYYGRKPTKKFIRQAIKKLNRWRTRK